MQASLSRPLLRLTCALGVFAAAMLPVSPPPRAAIPPGPPLLRGVVNLGPGGQRVPAEVLGHPYVKGVALRDSWQSVERSDGVYDWSYFEDEIPRVQAAGKFVLLRVTMGGDNTPNWLMQSGIQTFSFIDKNPYHGTYNQQITIPVFWDPIFLAKKKRAIAEMGQRFGGEPSIAYVVTACVNAQSSDWFIPTRNPDITAWRAAGYTTQKIVDACKQTIDATMAAFPGKPVAMAVGPTSIKLDPSDTYVAEAAIAYARATYPGRFVVQRNSLSATTPDPALTTTLGGWAMVFSNQPQVAGQMLWYVMDDETCRMNGRVVPCDPGITLRRAVYIGSHYGMRFMEIYQTDILAPEINYAVRYAADMLSIPVPPADVQGLAQTSKTILLWWSNGSDEVGVVGYTVYRNGTKIGTTTGNQFTSKGLTPNTRYSYRVSTRDAVGNESPTSVSVSIRTLPP
jgi:hypothetical protein